MTRYTCFLFENEKLVDNQCIVGYEAPLQTFFFRSGLCDKKGNPKIWLGKEYKEFEKFSDLKMYLSKNNYIFLMSEDDRRELLKNIPGYRWSYIDILIEFKASCCQDKSTNVVIMPLHRFIIKKQIKLGGFRLFPPGSIDISDVISNVLCPEKEKWIEIYERFTLVVFLMDKEIQYPLGADENNEYLLQCIEEAHLLLDLIKYYYCRYDRPEIHPSPPGLVKDGTSTIINIIPRLCISRIYCEKISIHMPVLGRGLEVDELSSLRNYESIFEQINEVGHVLKQALKLK